MITRATTQVPTQVPTWVHFHVTIFPMPRVYNSKYSDFSVSEPISRRSKHPPYEDKMYVDISCPHCHGTFDLAADAISSKAKACLEHLRQCKEYSGDVSDAPAKKRKVTNDDLLQKLEEVQEEQRAIFRLVHESSGRGPPPPTTKEELARNIESDRQAKEQLESRFGAHRCSVCIDDLSQTLLLPCWHLCMCNHCASITQAREGDGFRCPICREQVEEIKTMPGL